MQNAQDGGAAADAVWYSLPPEVKQHLIEMLDPVTRRNFALVDRDTHEAEQALRDHECKLWIREHAAHKPAWLAALVSANLDLEQSLGVRLPEDPAQLRSRVEQDCALATAACRAYSLVLPWLQVGEEFEKQGLEDNIRHTNALVGEVVRRIPAVIGHVAAQLEVATVSADDGEYYATGQRLFPWYVAAASMYEAVTRCLEGVDPQHSLADVRDQLAGLCVARNRFEEQFPAFVRE